MERQIIRLAENMHKRGVKPTDIIFRLWAIHGEKSTAPLSKFLSALRERENLSENAG